MRRDDGISKGGERVTHRPRWIEVGKGDCRECGGTGVESSVHDRIRYDGVEYLKRRGYRCRACRGSGKRSVGYMDLRDESGR